jgi:hypothetical protein
MQLTGPSPSLRLLESYWILYGEQALLEVCATTDGGEVTRADVLTARVRRAGPKGPLD